MRNAGLKNEEYIGKLFMSGSNAVKRKNDAGVTVFERSNLEDGVIPGKLLRPKYNLQELGKAIDTRIYELIPEEAPTGPATVLRSVYQSALDEIGLLNSDKQILEAEINSLRSNISSLNATIQNLQTQIDGESLKASVAENQSEVSAESLADTSIDLQNAIQNATQEAIQRVSLTARNEALKEQINALLKNVSSLEEQVNNEVTKRNQIQASTQSASNQSISQAVTAATGAAQTAAAIATGAQLLGNLVFIRNLKQPTGGNKDITITSNHKSGIGSIKFESGDRFQIENAGTTPISVSITKGGEANAFLKENLSNTTVQPGSSKTITFSVDTNWWNGAKPKSRLFASNKTYNGTLTISSNDGTSQTFNVMLRKNRK